MKREGPPLEALTHRLAECPPEFLEAPLTDSGGIIDSGAVVSDLSRALGGGILDRKQLALFRSDRNRLRAILIASWLLHDSWFRARGDLAADAIRFLTSGLDPIASLVDAATLVSDPDRREELARLCLRALDMRPARESEAYATDRLTTLDSVERSRVVHETRAAEERVRQIREAMKKKKAEEAAAMYGRE